VTVERGGKYALRFASAHHRVTVWVDGRRAGEHVGAYEAFALSVALEPGRHRIVARVDWRDPEAQADAGYARGWFNWGGLNGEVVLEHLAAVRLDRLQVRTEPIPGGAGARVEILARLHKRGAARPITVTGRVGGRALRLAPVAGLGRGEATTVRGELRVPPGALWSPDRPVLHDLELRAQTGQCAARGSPAADRITRRVGFRHLAFDGGELRINGEPVVLRGASLPPGVRGRGDGLRPRDMDALIADLRAVGANATRAQRPLSDALLRRLDAAGILLWQEVAPWEPAGAWSAETPQRRARATARVERTVARMSAHPSVLTWSLSNEAPAHGAPGGQARWIAATARRLHKLDPTRPVAADLWGRDLPQQTGGLYAELDALGVTDYTGWYEEIDASSAEQEATVRERLLAMRALFPGKLVVVTEVGAESSARNRPAEPGGLGFHADLLERRLGTYAGIDGLDGVLVWNLRDFALRPDFRGGSIADAYPGREPTPGINAKGLFTLDREPKPALRAVRERLARLAP
ncbi:MAG TPA: glycoside hydrolase family 2 TIM barrel-domain containing protein, partial [Solirubrobacteraceae bacterium]|nr:glycoside hydrolase family 2 TIM barrel-domain containing protein [Solirubrobacteraceae bacterium]